MAIETVTQADSLEQGRVKWNSNDAELNTRISELENEAPFSSKHTGDKTTVSNGFIFDLSPSLGVGFEIEPGSVSVSVNGVSYSSNNNQILSTGCDFYIHSTLKKVVFLNEANGGSLDLINSDDVVITFRRRHETIQNQPG